MALLQPALYQEEIKQVATKVEIQPHVHILANLFLQLAIAPYLIWLQYPN